MRLERSPGLVPRPWPARHESAAPAELADFPAGRLVAALRLSGLPCVCWRAEALAPAQRRLRAGEPVAVVVPERGGVPEDADDDGERAPGNWQRPAGQAPALHEQDLGDEGTVEKQPARERTAT